jgi:Bardet-Biedl syndrome 9 protein
MCVQSLDGQLSFFEQDSFAFTRPLPSMLVPGPMCYAPRIDSFLLATPTMEIECYKCESKPNQFKSHSKQHADE